MFLFIDILFKQFFLYYVSVTRGLDYLFFVGNILLKLFLSEQIYTV
jgi:hypothetical protein